MSGVNGTDKLRLPAHLIGWAIFFIAPLLLTPGPGLSGLAVPSIIFPTIARNLILMIFFYINLFYLAPKLLKERGLLPFLSVMILVIIIVSLVNGWIHMTYTEHMGQRPGPPPDFDDRFGPGPGPGPDHDRGRGPRGPMMMLAGPILSSFLITIMVASVSTSIVLWNDWNAARRDEQDRALQRLASELAVLKLQISPHFLFNTLNNIRWLVRSKSENAEEAIVKLSQLLRYILYQTNHEKVALEKEVDNIRDYVSLQKMRLTRENAVEFSITGDPGGRVIVPLLFIPLLENFFKYGDFDQPGNSIVMEIAEGYLKFRTRNVILESAEKDKSPDSGIGLSNVKRRLALHYDGKYILNVTTDDKMFKVDLELIL